MFGQNLEKKQIGSKSEWKNVNVCSYALDNILYTIEEEDTLYSTNILNGKKEKIGKLNMKETLRIRNLFC